MIDIAVATAIVSIFLATIFSIFDSYIALKKRESYSNMDYMILKELDKNCSYEELNQLTLGNYSINVEKIEDIVDFQLINLIEIINSKDENKYFFNIINKNLDYIECELIKEEEKFGFIKYKK